MLSLSSETMTMLSLSLSLSLCLLSPVLLSAEKRQLSEFRLLSLHARVHRRVPIRNSIKKIIDGELFLFL
jgi:hypothetical protein